MRSDLLINHHSVEIEYREKCRYNLRRQRATCPTTCRPRFVRLKRLWGEEKNGKEGVGSWDLIPQDPKDDGKVVCPRLLISEESGTGFPNVVR